MPITRRVVVEGDDARAVAVRVADGLRDPSLRIAFVFADWRLDQAVLAAAIQRELAAPVVGCATVGVVAERPPSDRGDRGDPPCAVAALGFYGFWVRAGVGVVAELARSPLARSHDAVRTAATAVGRSTEALDPSRHVIVTLVDGRSAHVEPFCIGSAAAAPQLEVVGGCAAIAVDAPAWQPAQVWANGEALGDAGVVVMLELDRPFRVVQSAHLVPTAVKTVVTATAGRVVTELDGHPAVPRMRALIGEAGLDAANLLAYSFARYVDGKPYVRSITRTAGDGLQLASPVEDGHVLRLMRPGDLIGTTRRDLAAAAEHVGGRIEALLAFSCIGRHWQAAADGLAAELANAYAAHPTIGFQSYGEQIGMLLVNHTLTGLVIG